MGQMTIPNLRDWVPMEGQAKEVDETTMLDAQATETPDTVTGKNTNKEDTNSTPSFGKLGAQGRS